MRATGLHLSLLLTAMLGVAGCASTAARFKWTKPAQPVAASEPAASAAKPGGKPDLPAPSESPFKPSRAVAQSSTEKPAAEQGAPEKTVTAPPTIAAAKPSTPAPSVAGDSTKSAAVTASGLSVETLKLIDEELRDATPEERAEWYDQLKRVDVALVPEILRARRMSLQVAQRQTGTPATSVTAGYAPPSTSATSSVPAQNPFAALPATPPSTAPAPSVTPPDWPPATTELSANSPFASPAAGHTPYENRRRPADPTGVVPASHQPILDPSGQPTSGVTNAAYVGAGTPPPSIQHAVHQFDGQRPANAIVLQNHEYEAASSSVNAAAANVSPQMLPPTTASPTAVPWPPVKPATTGGNGLGAVTSQLPFGAGFVQNVVGLVPNRGSHTPPAPSTVPPANISVPGAEWQQQLERTTAYLEQEVATLTRGATPEQQSAFIRKHVALRMLYLMGNHQERALTAIPGIDPAEQEFWQQLFWGVSNALDSEHIPQSKDRATQAIAQLNSAVRRLQEQADLQIRNVSFCRQIFYFGNYERAPRDEFPPGQEVLLYAEIDNFKSEPTSDGQYRTLIRSSIELLSPSGELRKQIDFPATEDLCRNYRRDYFHNYQFTIPERMPLGPHTLKLTVVDELSGKIATYRMNFLVK